MTCEVRHGDGIAGLLDLPEGSADLVITDPPWGATRAEWDRALDWNRWWQAIGWALRPDGVVAVFASMRLAVEIVPLATRRFAYDLVWRKNRASGHLNARRQPLRAHESILVFGNAGASERYEAQMTDGHEPMHAATRRSFSSLYGPEAGTDADAGTTRRYPTSVLDVDVVPNDRPVRIHETQKPVELLRWLVRAYSRPGDLVVDPTAGSGATCVAARNEGRRALGWEIDPERASAAARWISGTDTPLFGAP